MKKVWIRCIAIFVFLVAMNLPDKPKELTLAPIVVRPKPHIKGGTEDFMFAIGGMESDHDQYAVNEFGNLGTYQFSPRTLRKMGIIVSRDEFLNNEELQDSVMLVYMKNNYDELLPLIKDKLNTYYNGIYITKSGIIAGAHLVGTEGVLTYFYPEQHHAITRDANGATIELYMRKFGNYKISFE